MEYVFLRGEVVHSGRGSLDLVLAPTKSPRSIYAFASQVMGAALPNLFKPWQHPFRSDSAKGICLTQFVGISGGGQNPSSA